MNNINNSAKKNPPAQTPGENRPLNTEISAASSNPKRKLMIIVSVALLVLAGSVGGYFLGLRRYKPSFQSGGPQEVIPTNVQPSGEPQVTLSQVGIRIPFVRNGNIYLYENGQETLVAAAPKKSSYESRNDNAYPFLSPDGRNLAYIEYAASSGFIPEGTLKIYNVGTKETKTSGYKTSYFHWNKFNQLEFETRTEIPAQSGQGIDPAQSKVKFMVLDPTSLEVKASEMISYEDRDKGGISGFPLYSDKKYIKFKDNGYYLVDRRNNTEKSMFEKGEIYQFSGWSPDGKYVIFIGAKQNPYKNLWISINTDDSSLPRAEIKVKDLGGGAGGDMPTGLKWYFNKGFVTYCMQDLFFVDGREPLELTHTSGGGCHNEEGFVATSPTEEYAFVKFDDRFEIHTKNGDKKVVTESTPIQKSRSSPKNLVWVNDDYMTIYESTNGREDTTQQPRVFLFDRKANLIKPIIENAYLSTFAAGIP